jgi:hypothetical protein
MLRGEVMGFYERAKDLNGKKVYDVPQGGELQDPEKFIPALRVDWESEDTAAELLVEVLQDPNAERLTGLVIGSWVGEMIDIPPTDTLETLIAAAANLPHLDALFVGDVLQEESEVSWIEQADYSGLWTAFPKLKYVKIRGSNNLKLGNLDHANLETLIIECGGLPDSVVKDITSSKLPSLKHLELYLGTDNYGWDSSVEALQPILSGSLFPNLSYLGLRDANIADELAPAVAAAPILDRIKILDMSLGTMTDEGGRALLASSGVAKLDELILNHHFMSKEVVKQLQNLSPKVDTDDAQEADVYGDEVYRYIAVSE